MITRNYAKSHECNATSLRVMSFLRAKMTNRRFRYECSCASQFKATAWLRLGAAKLPSIRSDRGHSKSLLKAPSKLSAWAHSTQFKCSQPSLSKAALSNIQTASYLIPRSSALSYCPSQQGRAKQVTPNPSIERTRSGSAGLAFISFWAKPAPPPRAAHVKR